MDKREALHHASLPVAWSVQPRAWSGEPMKVHPCGGLEMLRLKGERKLYLTDKGK